MWSEFFDCSLIADLCFINIKIPPENCPEPWRFVSGKMYPEKQEKKIKIHYFSVGFPYRIPSLVIAFISLKPIAPRNRQCFRLYGSHKVKNVEYFFPKSPLSMNVHIFCNFQVRVLYVLTLQRDHLCSWTDSQMQDCRGNRSPSSWFSEGRDITFCGGVTTMTPEKQ